ncbi:universal stress protein [Achromobacter agilis]|uniref:UspA domain-containing protein n=1 Tax=Achromobacter agilis TaxID=1353888 RepID=A0A446CB13_9BURK|nr:universal stress protein [Achromobacter agilis]SSW65024.1 hypothetical protein AGI3411_01906 [Achromobacter agilis]
MYRRILIPIDGSAAAELGLNEAMRLAFLNDAIIRLVCVVGELPLSLGIGAGCHSPTELRKLLREFGAEVLRNAARRVRARCIPVDSALFEAGEQSFEERLAAEAEAWGADLIVIGSHGWRGVSRIPQNGGARHPSRAVPMLLVREAASKVERSSFQSRR